eukprot:358826-Chlamydomonas_euryale.AAC.17
MQDRCQRSMQDRRRVAQTPAKYVAQMPAKRVQTEAGRRVPSAFWTGCITDSGCTDSGRTDSGRTHSGRTDSGRTDSGRTDSGRIDSGRTHSGHTDSGRTDSGRTHSGRTNSGCTDSGRTDSGRTHSGRTHSGRTDSGRTDSGRTDSGRTDSGRTDSGRTDSGRTDSGRIDSGRTGRGTHIMCRAPFPQVYARHGEQAVRDEFDWDLNNPLNSAHSYAVQVGSRRHPACHAVCRVGEAYGQRSAGGAFSVFLACVHTCTQSVSPRGRHFWPQGRSTRSPRMAVFWVNKEPTMPVRHRSKYLVTVGVCRQLLPGCLAAHVQPCRTARTCCDPSITFISNTIFY